MAVTGWGQRRVQETQNGRTPGVRAQSQTSVHAVRRQMVKQKGTRSAAASDDLGLPQAPGVLQINTADRDLTTAFINSDVIPKDTIFTLQIYPHTALTDSPTAKPLEVTATATEDLQPGGVFTFPKIPIFGAFWPDGAVTYNLIVDANGTRTHSAGQFLVGNAYWTYDDLNIAPLIYEFHEELSNRHVLLHIPGQYGQDPVTVVLNSPDLGSPLVVPASATSVSSDLTTLVVDLTQVPGMLLDRFGEFVVTVGQGGWSDTRVYTHIPWNPNDYDAAPPLTTNSDTNTPSAVRSKLRKGR